MPLILIIDDHALICELFTTVLSHAGYETVSALGGEEALSILETRRPDVILLDVLMPNMDGLETLECIRNLPNGRHVPVIMLTGIADRPLVIAAAKHGVKSYLLKTSSSVKTILRQIEQARTERSTKPILPDVSSSQGETSPSTPVAISPVAENVFAGSFNEMPSPTIDAIAPPAMTKADILQAVDAFSDLGGMPSAVSEVLQLTESDRASMDEIAETINFDPALALKILKLANSAAYARGDHVDNVHKAVMRIGLGQIRQEVMNFAMIDRFSNIQSKAIDQDRFWEHAVATGLVASQLAQARRAKDAQSAFTMGLLHDVGRLVLAEVLGDRYLQVISCANEQQRPLESVESEILGLTHADVTERLFRQWKFPNELIHPVARHHLSASSLKITASSGTIAIATLALANRIVHALLLGSSGNDTIYPTDEFLDLVHIDPAVVVRIIGTIREETDKIRTAILARNPKSDWIDQRVIFKSHFIQTFRPLYVSSAPIADAYGILCEQLAESKVETQPNVGIINIHSQREAENVCRQYRLVETERGYLHLPLIVISPSGKISPTRNLIEGRHVQMIASPFTVHRFIEVVNWITSLRAAA
ncbi:MAG TPA: response regulator [Phycisphaerales bacterium]|nr:response regulator [Phycisphaerales bacterium]